MLCLLLLGVVQLAVVISDQIAVTEAARSAVRAAAVAADPAAAASAAADHGSPTMRVATSVDGQFVTVTVTRVSPTEVPLIGLLLPDIEVRSTTTMILEPP